MALLSVRIPTRFASMPFYRFFFFGEGPLLKSITEQRRYSNLSTGGPNVSRLGLESRQEILPPKKGSFFRQPCPLLGWLPPTRADPKTKRLGCFGSCARSLDFWG